MSSMSVHKSVTSLQGGSVLAECGPMRLMISAFVGRVPQHEMGKQAAEESFRYLERIAAFRPILGERFSEEKKRVADPLVEAMVRSVRAMGEEDLTPMAAVAGTIGDAVADYLFERGMTRVVVDNGGDVAVRLRGGEPVRVGVRPDVHQQTISYVVALGPGRSSWGVATSGVGGRSLTRGVASAATVVAHNASLADAAATAIANASFVEDRLVVQRLAEEVQPDTDLRGVRVTVKVGALSETKKEFALSRAMNKAVELIERGAVLGVLVAVQGRVAMTDSFRELLL